MLSPTCARCGAALTQGDRVTEVRVVRLHPDGSVSHDRADQLAHLTCPTEGE